MTKDSYEQNKVGLVIDVLLITDDNQTFTHKSRNISTLSVVLEENEDNDKLSVGSIVSLQVCCLPENEEAQIVKSEVTKISNEGIELRFML